MPDGYIVVTRQVGSALAVEEAVDLLLGLVLRGELCRGDLHLARDDGVDVTLLCH